jgi:hypothetical protein
MLLLRKRAGFHSKNKALCNGILQFENRRNGNGTYNVRELTHFLPRDNYLRYTVFIRFILRGLVFLRATPRN